MPKYIDVILPLAIRDVYTYSVPDDLSMPVPGCRVEVPLMRKQVRGIVLREHTKEVPAEWEAKIRPVVSVTDSVPIISAEQLQLWQWVSAYYMCTLGEVMAAALPSGILEDRYNVRTVSYISLPDGADAEKAISSLHKAPKQQLLYETAVKMCNGTGAVERSALLAESSQSAVVLRALIERGLLVQSEVGVSRVSPYTGVIEPRHPLTPAQQRCVDEIGETFASGKKITLLYGVTGSGKTDIYIHLIREQLEKGSNVLYLVPEIALTTQLTSRLQCIFGDQLMVYHSKLGDAERDEIYKASSSAEARVVIGARSAVFLPLRHIGLVIIDEEHDTSYKQTEPSPRYHARSAAIMLASYHKAHVLLGTATPSIESFYLAQQGKYGFVRLEERYGGMELPQVRLIDLKRQYTRKEMYGHLSDPLLESLQKTLSDGKQAILFQNRRGYASQLQCMQCGQPPRCVQCDITLTYHQRERLLQCHHCGYHTPVPTVCPHCGGELKMVGFGTERIEDEIHTYLPEARVLRMDLDSTRSKTAYQDIINAFSRHECDILVGTQMVTKGLHFDDVRLVAVLNADSLLNQPDYRAYERTYQMLEQVAGRAGRKGQQGEVLIQTFSPENRLYGFLQSHDYDSLYHQEVTERQMFQYPPFHRLIRLELRHHDRARVEQAAAALQDRLGRIFGQRISAVVVPSPERLQAYFLRTLTLRIENTASIAEAKRRLAEAIAYILSIPSYKSIKINIDVDS